MCFLVHLLVLVHVLVLLHMPVLDQMPVMIFLTYLSYLSFYQHFKLAPVLGFKNQFWALKMLSAFATSAVDPNSFFTDPAPAFFSKCASGSSFYKLWPVGVTFLQFV